MSQLTVDSVLIRARAAAEALMQDSCIVTRRTTHLTNPDTGVIVQNYSTLYTGKCRVTQRTMFDRPRNVGEQFELMLAVEVQLPVAVTGVNADDIITVTASVHDPDLVNRVFHVRGIAQRTHLAMRRFQAIEINS